MPKYARSILATIILSIFLFISNNLNAQTNATNDAVQRPIQPVNTALNLVNLKGKSVDFNQQINNGKATVVKFWSAWAASNCRPCEMELNRLQRQFKQVPFLEKVQLITINIDKDSQRVHDFVTEKQWEMTVLMDNNQFLQQKYGITNIPSTLVFDQKGTLIYSDVAPNEDTYEEVLKRIVSISED